MQKAKTAGTQKALPSVEVAPPPVLPSSVVWVVQQPRPKANGWVPDLQSANRYGRIEFIFDAGDRAYSDPVAAVKKAKSRLVNFDPENDFLCWSHFGDPATLWLTVLLLGQRATRLKFLYWSRSKSASRNFSDLPSEESGFYFPIEIDVR